MRTWLILIWMIFLTIIISLSYPRPCKNADIILDPWSVEVMIDYGKACGSWH